MGPQWTRTLKESRLERLSEKNFIQSQGFEVVLVNVLITSCENNC